MKNKQGVVLGVLTTILFLALIICYCSLLELDNSEGILKINQLSINLSLLCNFLLIGIVLSFILFYWIFCNSQKKLIDLGETEK